MNIRGSKVSELEQGHQHLHEKGMTHLKWFGSRMEYALSHFSIPNNHALDSNGNIICECIQYNTSGCDLVVVVTGRKEG